MSDFLTAKESFANYTIQRLEDYLDGKVTDRDLRQDLLIKANEMLLLKEVLTEQAKWHDHLSTCLLKTPGVVDPTCSCGLFELKVAQKSILRMTEEAELEETNQGFDDERLRLEDAEDAQVRADEQARSHGFESEENLYTSDERADAEADEKERAAEYILNRWAL